jgi:hypothetical protein
MTYKKLASLAFTRRLAEGAACSLLAAGLLSSPVQAASSHVADFALLNPGPGRPAIEKQTAQAFVARASAALGRQPNVTAIRVEGVSAGQASAPGIVATNPLGTAPGATYAERQKQNEGGIADLATTLDLAMAWRITGDRAFLRQANRFLAAWATGYQMEFNPINDARFNQFILAYDLTERDLPPATRAKMDDFLRRLAAGYLTAMETGKVLIPATLSNNWQSHRIELAGLAAFQLGDADLIARTRAAFVKQLAANLRPDGSTLDFAQRDALHYVTGAVEPLLSVALAAKVHGQDWYAIEAPNGSSLPKTLAWFSRFASGEIKHVEFAKSVVPYDRERAAAGSRTNQQHEWEPVQSTRVFMHAALLDPRFARLRDKLIAEAQARAGVGADDEGRGDWLAFYRPSAR